MQPQKTTPLQPIPKPGLSLDSDGYLISPEEWNKSIATELALLELIPELYEQQWQAIEFVRDYYFQFGAPPSMRRVCRALALSPYKEKAHGLFNGCLQLWRIAGLPNPGDEARAHLNH